MQTNKQILKKIQGSYKNERLIPFIGAGFTQNIDGYPDWKALIDLLKQDLKRIKLLTTNEKEFDDLPNFLEKTEYYVREIGKRKPTTASNTHEDVFEYGRKKLINKIKNILDPKKPGNVFDDNKWRNHLCLLDKFKNKMIYTTNWDDTLERPQLKSPTIHPRANHALSKNPKNDGHPRIIKYHGDVFSAIGEKFLVASLTDYQRRMTFSHCLDIKFKSDLLRYDLLMLGYSLADPNIHLMIHQLGETINATNKTVGSDKMNTKIYMVVLEKPDDLRVNLLKDTYFSLKPYHLLNEKDGDYDVSSGMPIPNKVKLKMEKFLKSL